MIFFQPRLLRLSVPTMCGVLVSKKTGRSAPFTSPPSSSLPLPLSFSSTPLLLPPSLTTFTASITATLSHADARCFGQQGNGTVNSPQGGTPPYTYIWTPSKNPGSPLTTTSTTVSLDADDTHSLTIRDQNSCTASIGSSATYYSLQLPCLRPGPTRMSPATGKQHQRALQ